MDELTQKIIAARQQLSAFKQEYAEAKDALDLREAELFMECDYKALGSNEAIRKAKFAANVLAADAQCVQLKGRAIRAEREKDNAYTALECLLDQRRAYENALRAEFIKGRYGVSVVVESSDGFAGFELSVMEEKFFDSI